jgi:hypothetical protein
MLQHERAHNLGAAVASAAAAFATASSTVPQAQEGRAPHQVLQQLTADTMYVTKLHYWNTVKQ